MDRHHRRALAAVLATWACVCHAAWYDGKDDITEPFLAPPGYYSATMSPSGTRLALITPEEANGTRVTVIDLDKQTSWLLPPFHTTAVDPDNPHQVMGWVHPPIRAAWMDDDRLAVDFAQIDSVIFRARGNMDEPVKGRYLGMARVGYQTEREPLVEDRATHLIHRMVTDRVPGSASGRPPPGYLATFHRDASGVMRRDDTDERVRMLPLGMGLPEGKIMAWTLDASGLIRIVRLCTGPNDSRLTVVYRKGELEPWRKVDERSLEDDVFVPVSVTGKPEEILVLARNGGDRTAVWRYDVIRHAFLEQVAAQPDADVTLVARTGGSDGVEAALTEGLAQQTLWLDERMKKLQAAVDAVLPDNVNTLQAGDTRRILVQSASDVDPGTLYVLDTVTLKMELIARQRPTIAPKHMQEMQKLRYPARDGLQVPAYLTLPGKPRKPVPLIVLVHGGPQQRDHWAWNEEVQVYAAHGYAVFQPQFRGSTGFGKRHEEAGYGQWGQAMQDDITDGVRWLIDHGVADPARVCIVGASYGGYAALWGLVKTPELYKCGVSAAGVSDLQRELTEESDLSKAEDIADLLHHRIGDPTLMQASFDEVSPLKQAARIKVPVLLVHGDLDKRVPVSQGLQMFDALRARNADVRWLHFPNEAHSMLHVENRRMYYEQVLSLLKRTIGKGEPPGDR